MASSSASGLGIVNFWDCEIARAGRREEMSTHNLCQDWTGMIVEYSEFNKFSAAATNVR